MNMCIIMQIPLGEKIPSLEVFKICAKNNADGMGFMYRRNNVVKINKGYFNVDDLYKAVKKIKNSDVCVHFRYSTHGLISPGNCHPFPLTNDVNKLQSQKINCEIGIAHNGIIQGMIVDKSLSDTMVFIRDLNVDNVKEIPSYIKGTDGKFLIMTKFKTYLIGNFVYDDGIYYSNDGYKKLETTYYSTSSFNGKYDPYIDGDEMCEYCKHQYIEPDVVNKKKDDPCISCDGMCNFDLSDQEYDQRRYRMDFNDDDDFYIMNDDKEDISTVIASCK